MSRFEKCVKYTQKMSEKCVIRLLYYLPMEMSKRIDVVLSSHYSDLMERYEELKSKYRRMEKEYKALQVEHSRVLFDMDAVIEHEVEVKCKKLTAKLEKENEKLKEELEHRDSFFSIMRDVLANEKLKFDFYELREILYCVVHEEC